MSPLHQTVLLREAVESLVTDTAGVYVDATFGRGGHSEAILNKLDKGGQLIAVDKDPQAIAQAHERFDSDKRFSVYHAGFSELPQLIEQRQLTGKIAGVLLDLGVSSPQLDQADRGFSFLHDGPLDMRMNPQSGISAAEWLASASADEMSRVFREFGEERFARRIASAIARARQDAPIETTRDLAEIVRQAHPAWEKNKHPATRVFQAIRILINHELEELQSLLECVLDLLMTGGRLVVISFHSLEDRLVKTFIRDHVRGYGQQEKLPARLPVEQKIHVRLKAIGKAVRASDREVAQNPRARSAIMRVAEKVA
jgi:16S rRNA (cytosine1402-N4)-methyltransferase